MDAAGKNIHVASFFLVLLWMGLYSPILAGGIAISDRRANGILTGPDQLKQDDDTGRTGDPKEIFHKSEWYGTALAHISYFLVIGGGLVIFIRVLYHRLNRRIEWMEDEDLAWEDICREKGRMLVRMGPEHWNGNGLSMRDEEFLHMMQKILSEHICDPEFNVSSLQKSMFMSREHLYRKTRALIGESPSNLIRNLRLKIAANMLKEGKESITCISLNCGFSNPSNFARRFRMYFGVSPLQYRKRFSLEAGYSP